MSAWWARPTWTWPVRARAGRFKEDLLDRLSFEVLTLPPLRLRHGDVELLAGHFATRFAVSLGRADAPRFSDAAMARLVAHDWPGNVRELKTWWNGPCTGREETQ